MMELWKQKLYTHLLDFRQLFGPAVARVRRRRRGRGPSVRHRQVKHVPLAIGRRSAGRQSIIFKGLCLDFLG